MLKNSKMFNEVAMLEGQSPPTPAAPPPVETMTLEQLLDLRAQVQARLPMKLTDLNLEAELVLQYQQGKVLLNLVTSDKDTPANQRAQVQNSCAATLEALSKLQLKIYTAERLKKIEQILIKVVKAHLPAEAQAAFFDAYERSYEEG